MEGNPYLKYPELGDLRKAGYFLESLSLEKKPHSKKATAIFVSFDFKDSYAVEVEEK